MQRKVDVANLTLGMYIEELDRPWLVTPFPLEGILLQSRQEIETIQRLCKSVYIDTTRGCDIPTHLQLPLDNEPINPSSLDSFETDQNSSSPRLITLAEEIPRAKEVRKKTKVLIDTMHDDIQKSRRIDSEGSKSAVSDLMKSVMRNSHALLWLTYLKDKDAYTALHSMNVCVLSLVFGYYLGLDEHSLKQLGLSALLHDIGKLRIPLDVLNKPDKLNGQEMEVIKKHPSYGTHILLNTKNLPSTVVDVAHSHHERVNGCGYPLGLTSDQITFHSKITSIVDVYDALTSDRVYRAGMAPPEALKLMYSWRGRDFDSVLLEKFVRCIGIFPSGTLVELKTGEIGVVIPSRGQERKHPIVMLMLDKFKQKYYPLRIIDFKLLKEQGSVYEIKRVLPSGAYGINAIDYVNEISAEFKRQMKAEF